MSADERESQLSAMFDGELPDSECELLARRLSRDPSLQQQWARYSLIGAVIRDEPLHARRAPGGRVAAGIAARLSHAIEAEATVVVESAGAAGAVATDVPDVAVAPAAPQADQASRPRWARPAAGFAIAAGVAALSVFALRARAPEATPAAAAVVVPARDAEMVAPAAPVSLRGAAAAEVVVAGGAAYPAAADRGPGSGEPESYVVPIPAERRGAAPPAQLANYVVAHSEYSGPLSRRSLLSALVAADATVTPAEAGPRQTADTPPEAAPADGPDGQGGSAAPVAPVAPGLRSAEAPR
ncbi:MAG: sigma-E factor negative regulatory protein [Steroidobacteraceae bacterium]|nr:sigma-E factor negative regulatory protein [Steroidobacteraceae bacterium]